MNIQKIIEKLGLIPHPEGGYYCETFRAEEQVELNGRLHSVGTSIYYLLHSYQHSKVFSAWHRMHGLAETWNYHAGDDLTLLWIDESDKLITKKLGMGADAEPQVHIPKDTWFAAFVDNPSSEAFCLVGCTVFPGFDFSCFELAKRSELISRYPQHQEIIQKFTPEQ